MIDLPRGKTIVLKAEDKDYDRGLLVKLQEDGGYDVAYWYGEPSKVYPAEVKIDGKSITKDGKVVHIGYHPELKEADPCWKGYKQIGMKKKNGKEVPNCVPEIKEHCGNEHWINYDVFSEETGLGYTLSFLHDKDSVTEAKYKDRKVKLNKPMSGDVKKFKVYVNSGEKNADGTIKVKKVEFGQKGARIKASNPERRSNFRARHNCETPGPKTKARYWSCKAW